MSDVACVFCDIVAGRASADFVWNHGPDPVVAFRPLTPVTPGHALFIPKDHLRDAAAAPGLTGMVFAYAAVYAAEQGQPFNLLTSTGEAATQSVFHLHVHYVPRAVDDGLMLPWGTLHGENPADPHRCRRVVELERQLAGPTERRPIAWFTASPPDRGHNCNLPPIETAAVRDRYVCPECSTTWGAK